MRVKNGRELGALGRLGLARWRWLQPRVWDGVGASGFFTGDFRAHLRDAVIKIYALNRGDGSIPACFGFLESASLFLYL
jgi:hypothetical protein